MEDIKRKNIYLSILVIIVGLAIAGGTYAYMTLSATVSNGTYNTGSKCFIVDYTDNTQTLTGTLFPSVGPSSGIVGSVSLKVNSTCNVNGIGTLYLHVNSGTSSTLGKVVDSHCENPKTLETLKNYTTQSACVSNGGKWTSSSALKYAVYDNNSATGTPLAVGFFNSSSIGNDAQIYKDFTITSTEKTYYIFVWLDGYISDNSYTDLTFNGYIKASATQSEDLVPNEYQKVEYIESDNSQYINTGILGQENDVFITKSSTSSTANYKTIVSAYNSFEVYYYKPNLKVWKYATILSGDTTGLNVNIPYVHKFTLTTTTTSNIQIFTYNGSATYNLLGKIYYVKWYRNDELIHNFVPCYRKSDNVAGLYDTVNNVFYTNSGSGTFTVGDNV